VASNRGGESATIIGRWLRARRNRDRMVIATKVGRLNTLKGLSAATIQTGAEASLRRIAVERVDLCYAHADDPETPLEETLLAFDGTAVESVRAGAAGRYLDARGQRVLDALRQVGEAHGCAMAAVAVAWLLADATIPAAIAGTRTMEQLAVCFRPSICGSLKRNTRFCASTEPPQRTQRE